ncbi:hypothetical protein IGI86_002612 [Enterococcus sp. AZ188]|uniref:hypothetical protein n=1 Tax=Enterococcus sp. AZ188 TaxID=2774678 RepID=UPI003D2FF791
MESPITFKGYKINSISYETSKDDQIDLTEEYKPDISFGVDSNFEMGTVQIISVLNTIERQLTINISGFFELNKNYTEDEEEIMSYLGINGSAILLPYVRAIVSVLTTLDSNQAIVLPTINVVELLNNR